MPRSLIIFLSAFCSLLQAQVRSDSLVAALGKPGLADTAKARLCGEISWQLLGSNMPAAYHYAMQELALAKSAGSQPAEAQAESDIGNVLNRRAEYDSALVHYRRALDIRTSLGQKEKTAGSYGNIATVLMRQSKLNEALEMNFAALRLFDELGDSGQRALVMGNIGTVYQQLGRKDEATLYFRNALALVKDKGQSLTEGNLLVNLGGIFYSSAVRDSVVVTADLLDSADACYKKAEALFHACGAKYNLATVFNDLGKIRFMQRRYAGAAEYYARSVDLRKSLGDRYGVGLSLLSLSDIRHIGRDDKAALSLLSEASEIFRSLNNLVGLKETYRRMSDIYSAMNDAGNALRYQRLYAKSVADLYTTEIARQSTEMREKYESEKKDLMLRAQAGELRERERDILIRNIVMWAILSISALVSIVIFLYLRKRRVQRESALRVERAERDRQRVRAVMDAEEKERARIARELHDGVGQMLAAARLNLAAGPGESARAMALLDESAREVRSVSHQMMPYALEKLGFAQAVKELVAGFSHAAGLKVHADVHGITQAFGRETELILYRCIQELLSNVVRHANATEVGVHVSAGDNEITVMVEDNGRGISQEALNASTGIGLSNIRSRMEYLGGSVTFDAMEGRGTTVILEAPVVQQ